MHDAARIIEELRQSGVKVRVQHRRPILGVEDVKITEWELKEGNNSDKKKFEFSHYGGETIVVIGEKYPFKGIAECSKRDRFNRKIGLQIAFGRAWKQFCEGGKNTL